MPSLHSLLGVILVSRSLARFIAFRSDIYSVFENWRSPLDASLAFLRLLSLHIGNISSYDVRRRGDLGTSARLGPVLGSIWSWTSLVLCSAYLLSGSTEKCEYDVWSETSSSRLEPLNWRSVILHLCPAFILSQYHRYAYILHSCGVADHRVRLKRGGAQDSGAHRS